MKKIKNLIPLATAATLFAMVGCSAPEVISENTVKSGFELNHLSTSTSIGVLEQSETAGFTMTATSSIINVQHGDFHELLVTQIEGEPEVNFSDLLTDYENLDVADLMLEHYSEVKNIIEDFDFQDDLTLTPNIAQIPRPTLVVGDDVLDFDLYSKSAVLTLGELQPLLDLVVDNGKDIMTNVPELVDNISTDTQLQLNVIYMGLETPDNPTEEELEAYEQRREHLPEGDFVFVGYVLELIDSVFLEADLEVAYFERELLEGSALTLMQSFFVQFSVLTEDVTDEANAEGALEINANTKEPLDKGVENALDTLDDLGDLDISSDEDATLISSDND